MYVHMLVTTLSALPITRPLSSVTTVIYLRVERSCGVNIVHRQPCHKHVYGGAVAVGGVTFLHNHYFVPHVEVHKVSPEVGAC